jgi:thymidylate synthase (FAD)
MYWKGNLHNLFNFLALRCDAHAQYEIRVYADAILDLIEPYVPWAVKAFKDYSLEGTTLSKAEIEVIRGLILAWDDGTLRDDLKRDMKDRGASPREIREFLEKVNGRN